MSTSYKVRIWAIRTHKNKTKKDTYSLRWIVEGAARPFCQTFDSHAMAQSFRAKLVVAKSNGEAFDLAEGLPVSMLREKRDGKTWYMLATEYVDAKWPKLAAGSRRTLAQSLATVTSGLVTKDKSTTPENLYGALVHWAFNKPARLAATPPEEYAAAIRWIERHSLAVSALLDPTTVRLAYTAISIGPDGKPFTAHTFANKRTALTGPVRFAIESGLLTSNPLDRVTVERPRKSTGVDKRSVVNCDQARALLAAVPSCGTSAPPARCVLRCALLRWSPTERSARPPPKQLRPSRARMGRTRLR